MPEYIALDFETANPQRVSACSVGGCVISNDQIVDRFSSFIKPPTDYFALSNVAIHHITPDMVADAPTFADLFPRFCSRVNHRTVISYTRFDLTVIESLFSYFGLSAPFKYVDVCALAREKLPQLPNHRLPTVAAALGLGSFNHHDASADAEMCARVFLALRKLPQNSAKTRRRPIANAFSDYIDSVLDDGVVDVKEVVELRCFLDVLPPCQPLDDLATQLDAALADGVITQDESNSIADSLSAVRAIAHNIFDSEPRQPTPRSIPRKGKPHFVTLKPSDVTHSAPADSIDPNNPLYGKTVVFTGELSGLSREKAWQTVVDLGGKAANGVTRSTNFLVVGYTGEYGVTSKQKMAERYIQQGRPISIIDESEFLRLTAAGEQ